MTDQAYLQKALALAQIRRGFCAPNPSVGAVLVVGDTVIGEGYHWAAGSPHAEVGALLNTPNSPATLYVTLEPCCHHKFERHQLVSAVESGGRLHS